LATADRLIAGRQSSGRSTGSGVAAGERAGEAFQDSCAGDQVRTVDVSRDLSARMVHEGRTWRSTSYAALPWSLTQALRQHRAARPVEVAEGCSPAGQRHGDGLG
jgi:hypothetical protein